MMRQMSGGRMAPASQGGRAAVSLKICLAGEPGVGKTSLLYRYVSNTFDKQYATTLGVKVSSRRVVIEDPGRAGGPRVVELAIWDIMGHVGFRELFKDAYFKGAQGVILVCDGSRPETLRSVPAWYNAVRSVSGPVPAILLLNKSDLGEAETQPSEVEALCKERGWSWLPVSARTGQNVEEAFATLVRLCLPRMTAPPSVSP